MKEGDRVILKNQLTSSDEFYIDRQYTEDELNDEYIINLILNNTVQLVSIHNNTWILVGYSNIIEVN